MLPVELPERREPMAVLLRRWCCTERFKTVGRVVVAGGVAQERVRTGRGVIGRWCWKERLKTVGGIVDAVVVKERLPTDGRVGVPVVLQ